MENSQFQTGLHITSFLPWQAKFESKCSFGGHMLLAYSMNQHIFIYDYVANTVLFTLAHSYVNISALAWNHTSSPILAASNTDGDLILTHIPTAESQSLKVEKKALSLAWHSLKDWVVMGCEQAIYIVDGLNASVLYSYNTELTSYTIMFDTHYTERILFLDIKRSSIGILKNFKDAEINILELQEESINSFLISPCIKDAILVARGNAVSLYHSEGVYIGECLICEEEIKYLLAAYTVNERLIVLSDTSIYLYELSPDISYTNYQYTHISTLKLNHNILTADLYRFIGSSPALSIISEDSLLIYELDKKAWKLNYCHSISIPRGIVSYNDSSSNLYLAYSNTVNVLSPYLSPLEIFDIPEDALYLASHATYIYIITSTYTLLELELTTGEITEIKKYSSQVNGICIDGTGEYLAISIEYDLEVLRLKHKDKEIEDIYSYDLTVGEVIYSMKWEPNSTVLIYATDSGLYKLVISIESTEKDDELAFEFST